MLKRLQSGSTSFISVLSNTYRERVGRPTPTFWMHQKPGQGVQFYHWKKFQKNMYTIVLKNSIEFEKVVEQTAGINSGITLYYVQSPTCVRSLEWASPRITIGKSVQCNLDQHAAQVSIVFIRSKHNKQHTIYRPTSGQSVQTLPSTESTQLHRIQSTDRFSGPHERAVANVPFSTVQSMWLSTGAIRQYERKQ